MRAFDTTCIFLVVALGLIRHLQAETVQYFYEQQADVCWYGNQSLWGAYLTDNGGLCAYDASINRLYACPAPDGNCWTNGIDCFNVQVAGPGQILCSNTDTAPWCCKEQETCTSNRTQHDVCIPAFVNPLKGVPPSVARQSLYAAISSTSLRTVPPASKTASVFSTSTFTLLGLSTATPTQPPPTSSPSSTGDNGRGISGGAIAGIVIGALVALAIICGIIAFLVLYRRRTSKNTTEVFALSRNSKPELRDGSNALDPSGSSHNVKHELHSASDHLPSSNNSYASYGQHGNIDKTHFQQSSPAYGVPTGRYGYQRHELP